MLTTCNCQHCGAAIDFDAQEAGFGAATDCPSCGQRTPLFVKKSASVARAPAWVGWAAMAGIVLAGIAGVLLFREDVVLLLLFLVGSAVYFLPSLLGMKKRNAVAIFVLNLVAGWTFIGWVVSLVWACTKDRT